MKGRMKINEGYLQLVKRKDSTEEGDRLIEGAQEEGREDEESGKKKKKGEKGKGSVIRCSSLSSHPLNIFFGPNWRLRWKGSTRL